MALYPKAVLKLIPSSVDGPIKPRVAILHIAVSEAASLYDYFKNRSGGIESHFYIRRDGTVEQYRDTALQADANMQANDFAVSIETQGMGSGEWTVEQLEAIKELLLWLNKVHGIPLVKCPAWNGSGVGYHILFLAEWAGKPRSCPGPDRIKQFDSVLVPWMARVVDEASRDEDRPAPPPPAPAPTPAPAPKPAPKPAPTGGLTVKVIDLRNPRAYVRGPGVRPMQRLLGVPADGIAGPVTRNALAVAQRRIFGSADLMFGPMTASALLAGK